MTDDFLKNINDLLRPYDDFLCGLQDFAGKNFIPVAKFETIRLLEVIVSAMKPRRALEVGTAIGFSGIILAGCLAGGGMLDTIDNDPDRLAMARINIEKAGMSSKINIIAGDAFDVLRNLDKRYDFVFLDAAKGQYKELFTAVRPLLAPGALVASDNVLYKGLVSGPEQVKPKMRTIVVRMRQYLEFICSDDDFVTSVLDVGDGLALSVLKPRE